jgi:uncharacterized protein YoxC
MSISDIVIAICLVVIVIALERLIAHNRKEVQELKRQLKKTGVIDKE